MIAIFYNFFGILLTNTNEKNRTINGKQDTTVFKLKMMYLYQKL